MVVRTDYTAHYECHASEGVTGMSQRVALMAHSGMLGGMPITTLGAGRSFLPGQSSPGILECSCLPLVLGGEVGLDDP